MTVARDAQMSAEVKKEIELELAHVLFVDIVGYSKLLITRADVEHPELQLRMGIHSGPVNAVVDVNERANVAGTGINMAQRVMDCGDAGHILLSKHVAEDFEHYGHWQPHLHELGETEVKHGVRLSAVNLYTEELGNRAMLEKFKAPAKAKAIKIFDAILFRPSPQ